VILAKGRARGPPVRSRYPHKTNRAARIDNIASHPGTHTPDPSWLRYFPPGLTLSSGWAPRPVPLGASAAAAIGSIKREERERESTEQQQIRVTVVQLIDYFSPTPLYYRALLSLSLSAFLSLVSSSSSVPFNAL